MSRYPQPDQLRATPEQGEHTETILRELGYDREAIAGLRRRGAV
jgi:formyl-CoA transferase